jgi:Domain of unknown function (DUF4349)/Putative zinc-finger
MTAETHPIEKELVMAYLDGELSSAEAERIAAHVEHCAECRALADDFRVLAVQLLKWKVELAPASMKEGIRTATNNFEIPADEKKNESSVAFPWSWQRLVSNRLAWAFACGVVAVAIAVKMFSPAPYFMAPASALPAIEKAGGGEGRYIGDRTNEFTRLQQFSKVQAPPSSNSDTVAPDGKQGEQITGPLIARTATLAISVRNFEAARSSMDQIVQARKGYVGELKITSPKDGPQSLETTLRIPAAQFDAALADLKALGRVEQEQQGGEEVTAQVVDLEARLKNARETEARLTEVLRTRTGKIGDVLEVEKEMARVREEIEQMEAEQKGLNNRVAFASIDLNLTEEYQSQLNGGRSQIWLQMRNALVDGYGSAVDGFVGVLVLLLSVGPSLVIWGALLFWPARWAWRRWRKAEPEAAAGT